MVAIRPARPEDEDAALEVEGAVWAPYLYETEAVPDDWTYTPELWVVAEDPARGIVASADACWLDWDGDPAHLPAGGWQEVLWASRTQGPVRAPRWACALGVNVLPEARGSGLARRMLGALVARATSAGAVGVIAPVRPTHRGLWPHLPIDAYARLESADGRVVDPWIRTHLGLGGVIVGVCERSLVMREPHERWQDWLGMALPATGRLIPPGSIGWLHLGGAEGELVEESVWIRHDIAP